MNSKPNDGGPFHPTLNIIRCQGEQVDQEIIPGASLRAWLAGMATDGDVEYMRVATTGLNRIQQRLKWADWMIAELEKDTP